MKNAGTWVEVEDGIVADVKVSKMERPLGSKEIIDPIPRPCVTSEACGHGSVPRRSQT